MVLCEAAPKGFKGYVEASAEAQTAPAFAPVTPGAMELCISAFPWTLTVC